MTVDRAPLSPPLDGSIHVLPGLVDFHATHNADLPWAFLASDAESPVSSVSFLEFAHATHRIAHALRPGRAGPENEVVAILVNCDTILYLALVAGMVRAGLVPLLLSPRNSAQAITNLLGRTSCHRIVSQPSFASILSVVDSELSVEKYIIEKHSLPTTQDIFPTLYDNHSQDICTFELYPQAGRKSALEDIGFYLHSSGSTGLPKPVAQRHVDMLNVCNAPIIVEGRDHDIIWGVMACPTFHAMGIFMQLYSPLATGLPAGLFAPKSPASPIIPTPQNTLQTSTVIGCNGVCVVPAFVEAWAKSQRDVCQLRTMRLVVFSGGPLSTKAGSKLISSGAALYPVYGGTEFGPQTKIFDLDESNNPAPDAKTRDDWEWMRFPDRVSMRMVPQGDGTYEAQFLTCATHCPCVENLSDARGYATGDLFEPHPTKAGLWRICGRKDDVLVLGSGEKVVPIPQESLIASSPAVQSAVMFGRGKNQCGILVEPSPKYVIAAEDVQGLIRFRNTIWPVVDEANQISPTFARIFKEMIIVTDPSKPFIRAGKGTVIRKHSLSLYEREIDDLYRLVEDSVAQGRITLPTTWSIDDVEPWLLDQASSIASGKALNPLLDVFDQGFDSLYATFMRNRIVGALRSDPQASRAVHNISQNFIFEHPTVHDLAVAISALVYGHIDVLDQDVGQNILAMVDKYSVGLPGLSFALPQSNPGTVVLLTGSTGNVGSHILAALLANPRIDKVLILNRPSAMPHDRQRASFLERGLDIQLLQDSKLVSLVGDVAKVNFGLDPEVFAEIRKTTTHVLHNAWRVDFNLSLPSFENNVAGARKLIDFCSTIPHPVKLFFTSSVSATAKWDVSRGPVPEDAIFDQDVTAGNGYGASKLVTEQVLAKAADNGLQCTSVRLGQVCGPKSTGSWSTSDWVPIMVKSGMALGSLPDLAGDVSWLPADSVANTFVDLVLTEEPLPRVLNLVHTRPVAWRTVLEYLNKCMAAPLAIISFEEWLSKVEDAANQSTDALDRVPATKLLEFFRSLAAGEAKVVQTGRTHLVEAGGIPAYGTTKMQQFSASLRDLEVIDDTYAGAWVKYWKQVGFL